MTWKLSNLKLQIQGKWANIDSELFCSAMFYSAFISFFRLLPEVVNVLG